MTPAANCWFVELGFEVYHSPGVSRAWRRVLDDGSYLLVVDVGGYDLPPTGGPYSGMHLSARLELLDRAPLLPRTKDLFQWLRHLERKQRYQKRRRTGVLHERLQTILVERSRT